MSEPSRHTVHDLALRVTTPLFLGGASQQVAELRPPSVKGVMRFWHRAAGPKALGTEPLLFGSSSGKSAAQSPFLLQVRSAEIGTAKPTGWPVEVQYLCYGVAGTRSYIEPGTDLHLRLVFRPTLSDEDRSEVYRSLSLMSYFGGLGARSRRGFGSVVMSTEIAVDLDDLECRIRRELSHLEKPPYRRVEYTMFSESSRVLILPGDRNWQSTMRTIGGLLRRVRSAETTEMPEYPWSHRDARLVGEYAANGTISRAPDRAAFGLPHNYFFRDSRVTVGFGGKVRRASPLFVHVHPLANGQHAIVVTFLPAPFLPPGTNISVSVRRSGQRLHDSRRVSQPESYAAVTGFLDYLVSIPGTREVTLGNGSR